MSNASNDPIKENQVVVDQEILVAMKYRPSLLTSFSD